MHVNVLIIGQGICGTFLSHACEKAGLSFVVIDDARPHTASLSAAGLINPVTGRRIVTTWMIEELMPFAENAYQEIGTILGKAFMEKKELIDFFPSAQMRLAFLQRYEKDPAYLRLPVDEHSWDPLFHYELGYGLIDPCYLVNLPGLLAAARQRLQQQGHLREETFDPNDLHTGDRSRPIDRLSPSSREALSSGILSPGTGPSSVTTAIQYRDIHADRIVFCDGIQSFENPWFSRLPFAPNKGEALILEIPDLPGGIYKKGLTLAPWNMDTSASSRALALSAPQQMPTPGMGGSPDIHSKNLFWVGSSYEWSFTDNQPSTAFRQKTEAILQEWLKIPFRIVDHMASVRPATLERRPFVGFHPAHPSIGILNGMGTKGCSLAPFFAEQLARNILASTAIRPDADVQRFSKILSR